MHILFLNESYDSPCIRFGVNLASAVGNCVSKLATGETSVVYGGLPLGRLVYPLSGRSTFKFGDNVSSSDITECKDVRLDLRNFCSVGNERVGYGNAKSSWTAFKVPT